jgi:predicted XRE-type DNA-binding protein
MTKSKKTNIESEEGSGNVFADLGLADADELFARAQIGAHIFMVLEAQELKQREIAALLGIPQGEVSHLMNAHYNRFTTDKLLDFLKRLDLAVTISIRPHRAGEPYQEVRFAGPARPARPPNRSARLEPAQKRRKPVAA